MVTLLVALGAVLSAAENPITTRTTSSQDEVAELSKVPPVKVNTTLVRWGKKIQSEDNKNITHPTVWGGGNTCGCGYGRVQHARGYSIFNMLFFSISFIFFIFFFLGHIL